MVISKPRCFECLGQSTYWTEWSDAADRNPELKALVIHYPEPPDGCVLIRCSQGCYDADEE